jgi:hypothetical protein
MTFGAQRLKSSSGYHHRRLPPNAQQRAWGGVTFVSIATLCAWTLCSTLADTDAAQVDLARIRGDKLDLAVGRGDKLDLAVGREDKLVVLQPTAPASKIQISLFDPHSSLGFFTGRFEYSAPLQGDGNMPAPTSSLLTSQTTGRNTPETRIVQRTVLPMPRPASAPPRNSLADSMQGNQSAKPPIFARIFEKLFGKRDPVKLAYAASDDVGELAAGRYDEMDCRL